MDVLKDMHELRASGYLGVAPAAPHSVGAKGATIFSFPTCGRERVKESETITASVQSEDMAALMMRVAGQRDREAFVRIYEYFAPRVKSFLLGKNQTAQVAEEILQEAMLAVWLKAHLYRPEKAAVSTWIFTIARNKHIDRIRREKFPELDAEDLSLHPAKLAAAEDDCLAEQRSDAIREALSRLHKDQHEVIYMSFMQGVSHAEIGEQLGLPLGTVKSRIRLGFQRLRKDLGEVSIL